MDKAKPFHTDGYTMDSIKIWHEWEFGGSHQGDAISAGIQIWLIWVWGHQLCCAELGVLIPIRARIAELKRNHVVLWSTWLSWGLPQERKTSAAQDKFIRVISHRNRKLTALKIRAYINASERSSTRHISTSTIQRRPKIKPLWSNCCTEANVEKQQEKQIVWANKHKECTLNQWKSILWSGDLKSTHNFPIFMRRRKGKWMVSICVISTMKHGGTGVMVWGWFAGDTVGDI